MSSKVANDSSALDSVDAWSSDDIMNSMEDYPDIVSWINDILDPGEPDKPISIPLTELDRRVSHLIGTLELASEDTSSKVERLIEDISRGASRLTYDLHFMREGAFALQTMLRDVETKSQSSVSADTTAALEQLHVLDTAKRNMMAAREVLQEAESWSTLESDVTSLLGEQSYEKAAERLSEASKSMVVFQNTPEYENRRTLMVSLQNQLEASLSSALVAAVNSQDVAVCQNYFSIFRNIQRETEFRNYYYGSRRASLTESWQNAPLSDCDASPGLPSTTSFSQFLASFYASFVAILRTERSSIPAIFPDPTLTLATLITSTLSALQPTFSERLSSLSSYYGSTALIHLITAYKATEEFAVAADKILEQVSYSSALSTGAGPGGGTGAPPQRSHSRRRSSRLSISGRMSIQPPSSTTSVMDPRVTLDWDHDLFEPFIDFQVDYGSLERRLSLNALEEILAGEVRPSTDQARLLRERSVDVFTIAEDAMSRCTAFTRGFAFVGLIKSLNDLFVNFAHTSKAEIASRKPSNTGKSSAASSDLSDLDYTPEDWSDIQSLLHLLEAVRALRERLIGFEGKLRIHLTQVATNLRLARLDPSGFDISRSTRGAVQLLAQSSINTAELQALFDSVDPEKGPSQPQTRGGESSSFLAPTPPTPDPRRTSHVIVAPAPPPPLLTDAREALSNFAQACQLALQDTILRPLRTRLSVYASLPSWPAQGDSKSKRAGAGGAGSALSEVHVPTFSLSPTETMQRLAEGLLNLPRLFEVYADDDALSFSLDTLPFVDSDLLQSLAEPAPQPTPPVSQAGGPHSRRSPSLSFKSPPVVSPPLGPAQPELSPEAVSAAWLSSLSLSLLSYLISDVLPSIRSLSVSGAAQLASDLGYLSSIVMALNVECEDLEKWKEYVELDDTSGRQKMKDTPKGDISSVLATVARLRGWAI